MGALLSMNQRAHFRMLPYLDRYKALPFGPY